MEKQERQKNINKTLAWVKSHLVVIIISGVVAIGGAVGIVVYSVNNKSNEQEKSGVITDDNKKPLSDEKNKSDESEQQANTDSAEKNVGEKAGGDTTIPNTKNVDKPSNVARADIDNGNDSRNEPTPTPTPEPTPTPTPTPEPQGQDFTIFMLTSTPTLFGRGHEIANVVAEREAYSANGTPLTTPCWHDNAETCRVDTPLDWYRNVACEVYVGNTKNSTVTKITLNSQSSTKNVLVPYGYPVGQICEYIYKNIGNGGNKLLQNGSYIIVNTDGNPRTATYGQPIYYKDSLNEWYKTTDIVPNTYPNF